MSTIGLKEFVLSKWESCDLEDLKTPALCTCILSTILKYWCMATEECNTKKLIIIYDELKYYKHPFNLTD